MWTIFVFYAFKKWKKINQSGMQFREKNVQHLKKNQYSMIEVLAKISSILYCIIKYKSDKISSDNLLRKSKYLIKKIVIGKLKELYFKAWKTELFNDDRREGNQNNKLRTYRLFKQNLHIRSVALIILCLPNSISKQ
jgi:hypothetical protein